MSTVFAPSQPCRMLGAASSKPNDGRPSVWDGNGGTVLIHMVHAGLTCAAVLGLKAYRVSRQRASQPSKAPAGAPAPSGPEEAELAAARAELAAKEEQLRELQQQVANQRFAQDQSEELAGLRSRLRAAQLELLSAGQRCKEASERMARTACDLAVTETELRAHKAQLQQASQQLNEVQARLEAAEGELGLTRSQNLLMQREMALLRRQLRDAGSQLEGHLAQRAVREFGIEQYD